MLDPRASERRYVLGRPSSAPSATAQQVAAQGRQTLAQLDELLSEVRRQEAFWRFSDRLDKALGRRAFRASRRRRDV